MRIAIGLALRALIVIVLVVASLDLDSDVTGMWMALTSELEFEEAMLS